MLFQTYGDRNHPAVLFFHATAIIPYLRDTIICNIRYVIRRALPKC